MVVKAERFDIPVVDGGETINRTHILAEGTRIRHLALGYAGPENSPPIEMSVELETFDHPDTPQFHMLGGWVRALPTPTHMNDLTWDGDLKMRDQTRLVIAARNNTGGNRVVFCYIITERP